ncbi:hypothetical protein, partial [Burkholderia sp. SIMBA_024]
VVTLELTSAEALVFFDWLARANDSDVLSADDAEHRVLWDLESQLETKIDVVFAPDYSERVDEAKRVVSGPEDDA